MWLLNDSQTYAQAGQDIIGAAAPHVNISTIRNLVFALPDRREQDAIVARIEGSTGGIAATIDTARNEISLLREFRTRLITDVITGKLDVREAAARLPDKIPEAEPLDEMEDLSQDESTADDAELEAAE